MGCEAQLRLYPVGTSHLVISRRAVPKQGQQLSFSSHVRYHTRGHLEAQDKAVGTIVTMEFWRPPLTKLNISMDRDGWGALVPSCHGTITNDNGSALLINKLSRYRTAAAAQARPVETK
ncbi:hypothetical protein CMUS01_10975 [Colletotrichum musicola]|uniref:Uncharacterized protein n=1 Tax=Colletotrichum musicola TaxID=2175873 RepID=A0A8H6K0U7_9PEZI|nr:hypothetical protein CMUS01_10975 [Colletotrichum musicola]